MLFFLLIVFYLSWLEKQGKKEKVLANFINNSGTGSFYKQFK